MAYRITCLISCLLIALLAPYAQGASLWNKYFEIPAPLHYRGISNPGYDLLRSYRKPQGNYHSAPAAVLMQQYQNQIDQVLAASASLTQPSLHPSHHDLGHLEMLTASAPSVNFGSDYMNVNNHPQRPQSNHNHHQRPPQYSASASSASSSFYDLPPPVHPAYQLEPLPNLVYQPPLSIFELPQSVQSVLQPVENPTGQQYVPQQQQSSSLEQVSSVPAKPVQNAPQETFQAAKPPQPDVIVPTVIQSEPIQTQQIDTVQVVVTAPLAEQQLSHSSVNQVSTPSQQISVSQEQYVPNILSQEPVVVTESEVLQSPQYPNANNIGQQILSTEIVQSTPMQSPQQIIQAIPLQQQSVQNSPAQQQNPQQYIQNIPAQQQQNPQQFIQNIPIQQQSIQNVPAQQSPQQILSTQQLTPPQILAAQQQNPQEIIQNIPAQPNPQIQNIPSPQQSPPQILSAQQQSPQEIIPSIPVQTQSAQIPNIQAQQQSPPQILSAQQQSPQEIIQSIPVQTPSVQIPNIQAQQQSPPQILSAQQQSPQQPIQNIPAQYPTPQIQNIQAQQQTPQQILSAQQQSPQEIIQNAQGQYQNPLPGVPQSPPQQTFESPQVPSQSPSVSSTAEAYESPPIQQLSTSSYNQATSEPLQVSLSQDLLVSKPEATQISIQESSTVGNSDILGQYPQPQLQVHQTQSQNTPQYSAAPVVSSAETQLAPQQQLSTASHNQASTPPQQITISQDHQISKPEINSPPQSAQPNTQTLPAVNIPEYLQTSQPVQTIPSVPVPQHVQTPQTLGSTPSTPAVQAASPQNVAPSTPANAAPQTPVQASQSATTTPSKPTSTLYSNYVNMMTPLQQSQSAPESSHETSSLASNLPAMFPQMGSGSVFSNTMSAFNQAQLQDPQQNDSPPMELPPSLLSSGGWTPSANTGPTMLMDTSIAINSAANVSSVHSEAVALAGDGTTQAIADVNFNSNAHHGVLGVSNQVTSSHAPSSQDSQGHVEGGSSQGYEIATMAEQNHVMVSGQSDTEGMGTVLQQSSSDTFPTVPQMMLAYQGVRVDASQPSSDLPSVVSSQVTSMFNQAQSSSSISESNILYHHASVEKTNSVFGYSR